MTNSESRAAIRKAYALNDSGNADRFVEKFGAEMRYVSEWKSWIFWNGQHWTRDVHGQIDRWAQLMPLEVAREAKAQRGDVQEALKAHALRMGNIGRLEAMIKLATKAKPLAIGHELLDQKPMLLGVRNGTLDLSTGTLMPANPANLITKIVDIPYDESATCPLWESTLDAIFLGDRELIDYVQRAVGYSITGRTEEQVLHLCIGNGSNGKSTILDVLEAIAGDYGRQADFSTFLERRNDSGPRPDVARLAGARLVRSSETGAGKRLDEGLVKSLTGGDTITARFLFSNEFEFRPQFKLWLAANAKPTIRGTDYGIWRRVRLIPFDAKFLPGQNRENRMADRIIADELPGVLSWAVRGCEMWQEKGLSAPERVQLATKDYQAESDTLGQFLAESCELAESLMVPAGQLYHAYAKWCRENGEHALTSTKFGTELSDRGFEKKHTMNGKVRLGLRLHHEDVASIFDRGRPAA